MDHRALVDTLHMALQQKRYLIVLDDVWETGVWMQIKHALVDNNCGSRIVITTRNDDVASIADDGRRMNLELLNKEDARRLFCSIAFRGQCPAELEGLAWEIADKCERLPLALVCMGNLVAQNGQPFLEDIYQRLANFLKEYNGFTPEESYDLKRVHAILDLSISYLPYYLRSCFLYCSVFPRGHAIKRNKLIRVWVSAGFIQERIGSTMEEVAETYLNQLVGRCMFQVVDKNSNARIQSIKIHDLMYDVIKNKSREEASHGVYEGSFTRWETVQLVRHLSIVEGEINNQPLKKMRLPQLRSFHVFTSTPFRLSVFRYKLLRILNLEDAPIKRLPRGVVCLFNLRFLSIRGTDVSKLPKHVGNLRNLETLDTVRSQIRFMPEEITKLENLRHLRGSTFRVQRTGYGYTKSAVRVPKGVWNLRNLQTLKCVIADKFAHNLGSMTRIRTLHADIRSKTACTKLCESISSMGNLLNLKIIAFCRPRFRDRTVPSWIAPRIKSFSSFLKRPKLLFRKFKFSLVPDILHLETLNSSPPPKLQKLTLMDKLKNGDLPTWFNSLTNLWYLDLRHSLLQHDSIIQLNMMPQLVALQLWGAYDGGILCIPPAWFPRLKTFSLVEMKHLKTFRIGDNALQSLEYIYLGSCKKLKTIPVGIRNLTNVKKLILDDVPSELVVEIRYYGDEVKHIPCIEHWYQKDGNWKQELLSQTQYLTAAVRPNSEQSHEQIGTSTEGQSAENCERPLQD